MPASRKILIAEDEKPLSKALQLKFTSAGFTVTPAFNGEEVLELLKKEKFDLMLLDLMMPKLDGFSVLEELKRGDIKLPVIVTSNLSQPEDMKRVKELGAVDFLIKSE